MTKGSRSWDDPLRDIKLFAKGYSARKIKKARTKKGKLKAYHEGVLAGYLWSSKRAREQPWRKK